MQIQWLFNASPSALHAAEACYRFPSRVVDPTVSQGMGEYADRLGRWIDGIAASESDRFWKELIATGAAIDSNHELAALVLRKRIGGLVPATNVNQLSGLITDVEAAFKLLFPKYLEQTPLRLRPLQDHWLGFGSGLMAHIGRVTEKALMVSECRAIALQPILGGDGVSHIDQNLVRIEAVLTNPMAELPEVVRLAWLISQLQLDLPRFSDLLGPGLAGKLGPIAMLPPTLAAAEVLELSRCDEATVELAIENWQIAVPKGMDPHSQLIPTMMDWWETYLQTRPPWELALRALAKMLNVS